MDVDTMTRSLTIGTATIDDDSDCFVIAEIGSNHQGEIERAKQLIRAAQASVLWRGLRAPT